MTHPEDAVAVPSVVPEISPADNGDLPQGPGDPAAPVAEQGPAPTTLPPAPPVPTPSGEALSSDEVASLTEER